MFDITLLITPGPLSVELRQKVKPLTSYLEGIEVLPESIQGKNFEISGLRHKENMTPFSATEAGKHIIVLGDIFTNREYAHSRNTRPSRLLPADLLQMITKDGPGFINYIKGIFIIFLIDEELEKYQVFSCKSGLLDIYYHESKDFLLISTSIQNIIDFPGVPSEVDPVVLLQHSIFDYPLGECTLFKGIQPLPPSSILTYDLKSAVLTEYYNYTASVTQNTSLSWKETYRQTRELFNECIDLLNKDQSKLCASLTSGFDSRTNLSRLFHSKKDILYYSWGMPGSIEISIPQLISEKLGFHYSPVLLDKNFESRFSYYGTQAVMWSGGKGTIRRANHTYGYSILSKHSTTVITGLFGSELLRPANSVGHIFNQEFVNVFYAENSEEQLNNLLGEEIRKGFIPEQLIQDHRGEFIDRTAHYFRHLNSIGSKYQQLYYFSLTEGFRKYFGHEINCCRQYVSILSPYIDDDFVEFILRTPVPLLNKKAFQRNSKSLKLGQSIYLPVLKENLDSLMHLPTGRFYSPAQLNSVFFPLNIIPAYIKHKKRRKKDDTFDLKLWVKLFRQDRSDLFDAGNSSLNALTPVIENSSAYDLAKQVSLRLWLKEVGKF
ncbi:MAG: hypothetical protein HXX13_16815 [Bacteroidetes bacterium]|nr:hypothetical protein [Bacteroidota bacterium]